jgi:hypothetical protein
LFHVPSLRVVTDLLVNWDTVQSNLNAKAIMDKALHKFGRDNLFDSPTKVAAVIGKCVDQSALTYLCEWIYAHMLRNNKKDPYTLEDLRNRNGACSQILWQRRYVQEMFF